MRGTRLIAGVALVLSGAAILLSVLLFDRVQANTDRSVASQKAIAALAVRKAAGVARKAKVDQRSQAKQVEANRLAIQRLVLICRLAQSQRILTCRSK